jgi:hypothetical protein
VDDLARQEHHRFLTELLDTTTRTVERVSARMNTETREDRETLSRILHELRRVADELAPPPPPPPPSTLSRSSAVQFTVPR